MPISIERESRPRRPEVSYSQQHRQAAQLVETITGINEHYTTWPSFLSEELKGSQFPVECLHSLPLPCCPCPPRPPCPVPPPAPPPPPPLLPPSLYLSYSDSPQSLCSAPPLPQLLLIPPHSIVAPSPLRVSAALWYGWPPLCKPRGLRTAGGSHTPSSPGPWLPS